MPSSPVNLRQKTGFTLVEVLVITPIIILAIAILVGFFVNLTGDALMSRERSKLVYDAQNALDQLESDIRLSTRILPSTNSLPSPQGSNLDFMGTHAFASSNNTIVLEQHATTGNPYDGSRELVYYRNQPNECGAYQEYNATLKVRVVYFVDGTNLTKRTLVPSESSDICGAFNVWQKNSCKREPGFMGTVYCQVRDTIVARNVSSMNLAFFNSASQTGAIPISSISDATVAVLATINLSTSIAGSDITHNAVMRATRINQ